MRIHRSTKSRRGAVLVFSVFIIVFFLAVAALAVDLGFLMIARTEAQRAADAAALASAWELIDESALFGNSLQPSSRAAARARAVEYGNYNSLASRGAEVDANTGNDTEGDVVLGQLPYLTSSSMVYHDPAMFNAVQVRVRRTAENHGKLGLFFAPILGIDSASTYAEATAAFTNNVGGFQTPADGSNLELLPFALDEDTWEDLLARRTTDVWTWDDDDKKITSGGDGIYEVNLYPQGTGSPGNRGTVDIGSSNNSTNDIARQILHGISPADLEHHGGKLEFDAHGELSLNGDTGISAGVKDELASIRGKPRIIPIFRQVAGPGNNATYTIVQFVGVRILDVKLTGSMSSKRVIIQPANVIAKGAIPASSGTRSYFVFTKPMLVK